MQRLLHYWSTYPAFSARVKLRFRSMISQNVVGPQVRTLRAKQELTQEELAARCGVQGWHLTRGTLAKIEAQVRCVSDAELFILAHALRQPLDDLFPPDRRPIVAQLNQAEGD